MDEQQAIALLKSGNISGLEFLVRTYQVEAIRTAFLIVRDHATAEDIVQSAYVRVYERIEQFDQTRSFRPYFLRVVANAAIKRARQQSRTVSLEAEDADSVGFLDALAGEDPSPEELLERTETETEVAALLAQLPPEQRAVIVLTHYAGLTSAEIADRLEIPAGTVRWRLHAARRFLRSVVHRLGQQFDKDMHAFSHEEVIR